MRESRTWILILASMLVIVVGVGSYFIYGLQQDITQFSEKQQQDRVESQAMDTQLGEQLRRQSEIFSDSITGLSTDINTLADVMEQNTRILVNSIQTVDQNVRILDGALAGVASQFDDLSVKVNQVEIESQSALQELRDDVDALDADFSTFITDLYPAVVSVQTPIAQGSGFFFRNDGYIATNYHVVQGASFITVILSDGTQASATIVGSNSEYDVAVLKISGTSYLPLDFAPKNSVTVGERVVAVGNPLGLDFSLSQGVVSALERTFVDSPVNYVQTDTPINPGNSGGPLIDIDGKVVGMNTAVVEGSNSIGFAIPAYQLETVIAAIMNS